MPARHGFTTRSVHAGEAPDPTTGAHGVPIYQNATYAFHTYEQLEAARSGTAPHFFYARDGNPTVRCLEVKLADLEGAEAAVATATGMAAVSATLLHLLAGGGHLVTSADVYAVTRAFLRDDLPCHGAEVTLVDVSDLEAVEKAMTPSTRAIYCEAFSNPSVRVADLGVLAALARRRGVKLVVDNTFLSPALCRPLEHGADVVIHSATKYLSGHGQILGGVACGSLEVVTPIARTVSRLGGAMSAFAAWTLLAGVKTLPLRMREHSANAARLAALLAAHPAVATVHYPGLLTHPGHAVARALVGDGERFGGMLAFALRDPAGTGQFLNALRLPTLAVSLGECGSLIWPVEGSDLIRLSVGIEDIADLEADFRQALSVLQSAVAAD